MEKNPNPRNGGSGRAGMPTADRSVQTSGRERSALEARLPHVEIDGEDFWRVEGDYLLDVDQLFLYEQERAAEDALRDALRQRQVAGQSEIALTNRLIAGGGSELVGILHNNEIVRWAPGTILTYCVLKQTFSNRGEYDLVVGNMQKAVKAWEDTCGIQFQYRKDLDDSPTVRPDVIFPVRRINAQGKFIAAAFFPNDDASRRRVLIDPSYFTQKTYDPVGVLRHELGHALGFRHEHIRSLAPRECPDESPSGTIDLTLYDPRSVMHYFCGTPGSEFGTMTMKITATDKAGAQSVYGPPLNTFNLITG